MIDSAVLPGIYRSHDYPFQIGGIFDLVWALS